MGVCAYEYILSKLQQIVYVSFFEEETYLLHSPGLSDKIYK
jgi:hypothetical protein